MLEFTITADVKVLKDLHDDLARRVAELEKRPAGVENSYLVTRDGNSWCASGPGFINLMESPNAFGDTPLDALSMLFRQHKADDLAVKHYATAKALEAENEELRRKLADVTEEAKKELAKPCGDCRAYKAENEELRRMVDGSDDERDRATSRADAAEKRYAELEHSPHRADDSTCECWSCLKAIADGETRRDDLIASLQRDLAIARAERGLSRELMHKLRESISIIDNARGLMQRDGLKPKRLREISSGLLGLLEVHKAVRIDTAPNLTAGEPAASMRQVQPGELPPEPREDLYTPSAPSPTPVRDAMQAATDLWPRCQGMEEPAATGEKQEQIPVCGLYSPPQAYPTCDSLAYHVATAHAPKPKPALPIRERCPRCGHAMRCGCGPEQSCECGREAPAPVEAREPTDEELSAVIYPLAAEVLNKDFIARELREHPELRDKCMGHLLDLWRRFSPPRGPVTYADLGKEQRAIVAESILQLKVEEFCFLAGELAGIFGLDQAAAREGRCVMKGAGK